MNTTDRLLKTVHWAGLCGLNVLKELLILIFLWLFFWWVNSMSLYLHDPTGAVTSFYTVVLGLPIGYLVIGFLRKGIKGLLIPLIVIFLLLIIGLYSWINYPMDAVETPFLELPTTLFIWFFLLTALVALGGGIVATFSKEKPV